MLNQKENDISRITMELEDLLMSDNAEVSVTEQEYRDTQINSQQERENDLQTGAACSEKRRRWQADYGLLAAFVIPMMVLLIIFIQRGIYPFGHMSFLRTDMYHQYAPFFGEFHDKLHNGGSLSYSWNVGMGVNFTALYAYYLASPLNWLLVVCPKKYIIEFMTGMIVLKTGLCGLSMAWYLRKHCGTKCFGVAFFGIFYALSGYMAAYSWNIMWLDCIILFPLIMWGLEKLVREGNGLLYGITLAISIFSNYYISIMTCIFMVIYFLALMVLEDEMSWEKFMGRGYRFVLYSVFAGGTAAVLLIPEICALQFTASGSADFPKTFTQYFTIIDMAARHIGNVELEIGLEHWPNIYCGVAVLMFVPMYLLAKRVPLKEKAVNCILLLFFYASFSMNILNFIWHGFHYPNSLPCRQSYIYIVLVLTMCCRVYTMLEDLTERTIFGAFWGAAVFVLIAQKVVTAKHFHFIVFYVALLFLALYLAVILFYRRSGRMKNAALFAGLLLVSAEAAINMTVTSITTIDRDDYLRDNEAVRTLMERVNPADTFYRVEKVSYKTKNDGAWMNFPSVSMFSSTAYADMTAFMKKLGCEASTNAYSINGSTPLVDSLLAVRYALYTGEPAYSELRQYLSDQDDIYLYENLTALPLGFVVDSDFESRWDLSLKSPADVQNSLADAVDADQVLILDPGTYANGKSMTFIPTEDGEYYAYIGNSKIDTVSMTTSTRNKKYDHVDRGYLLELGFLSEGQEVTLTAEGSSDNLWADIYRVSESGVRSVCEKLNRNPWRLTSWTDTSLEGNITCPDGGILLTTIPFDKGWSVMVDGVEETPAKMLDGFIGVRLSPGEHLVEMNFVPTGLKPGIWISLVSLLLMAVTAYAERVMRRRQEEEIVFELECGDEPACDESDDCSADEPPSDINL